jgi:hypothetical protein
MNNSEWVDVNDRLPKITLAQRFLILKAGYYHEVAVFSPDGKGGGYWYRGKEPMLEVTHWMPLPEIPNSIVEKAGQDE